MVADFFKWAEENREHSDDLSSMVADFEGMFDERFGKVPDHAMGDHGAAGPPLPTGFNTKNGDLSEEKSPLG